MIVEVDSEVGLCRDVKDGERSMVVMESCDGEKKVASRKHRDVDN